MAIPATVVQFKILFPEFDAVPDATIQVYLDIASDELSTTQWGTCLNKAILYLSAHELALSQNRRANSNLTTSGLVVTSSGAGAITSASAGGISAGFGSTATMTQGSDRNTYLLKTEYGQMYLSLKRECLSVGVVILCQG